MLYRPHSPRQTDRAVGRLPRGWHGWKGPVQDVPQPPCEMGAYQGCVSFVVDHTALAHFSTSWTCQAPSQSLGKVGQRGSGGGGRWVYIVLHLNAFV